MLYDLFNIANIFYKSIFEFVFYFAILKLSYSQEGENMTNKRTLINEIDTFKGTNLYKYQTRVHFNIIEDGKNLVSRWCDIRGKVSHEKARSILDSVFMTKEVTTKSIKRS